MGAPLGWYEAWSRSSSIDHCPYGAPREVLRKFREYDPQLVLRWDDLLHDISVWRKDGTYDVPSFQFFCKPYGLEPMVDNRLYLATVAGDRTKHEGIDRRAAVKRDIMARMETKARLTKEKARAPLDKIDYEKGYWAHNKELSKLDGKPRGLFAQVHADTPVSQTAPEQGA